mgnify:FL=1
MLAAAMDGIDKNLVAPKPMNNINIYELTREERRANSIIELPASLREALSELEGDEVLKKALGKELYEAFTRAKWAEWDDYRLNVMDWELTRYLETS